MNNWHDELERAVKGYLYKDQSRKNVELFTQKYPGPTPSEVRKAGAPKASLFEKKFVVGAVIVFILIMVAAWL